MCFLSFLLFFIWNKSNKLTDAEPIHGVKSGYANHNEYPFVVSLGYRADQGDAVEAHFCGGTLITRKHILTAAHCFVDETPDQIQAAIGNVDLQLATRYDVSGWVKYDDWADSQCTIPDYSDNDMAVVFLSGTVADPTIVPVILTQLADLQLYRTNAVITGWGATENERTSRYLRSANVKILTKEETDRRILMVTNDRVFKQEPNELFSAAEPYALTGNGDSGSPVLGPDKTLVAMIVGKCPRTSWGNFDTCFLNKYYLNYHLSINAYRHFIIAMVSIAMG